MDALSIGLWVSRRLSLHREVEHFMAYMKPTNEEAALRKDPYWEVHEVTKEASTRDGLHVVVGLHPKTFAPPSPILEDEHPQVEIFPAVRNQTCRVQCPVLRITDASTGIDIVLKGSDERSVRAREVTKAWMDGEDGKVIGSLVMVLKLFPIYSAAGESFTGGIDSKVVGMDGSWAYGEARDAEVTLGDLKCGWEGSQEGEADIAGIELDGGSSNNGPGDSMDLGEAFLGFLRFYGQGVRLHEQGDHLYLNERLLSLKPSMLGPSSVLSRSS
ncbi:hypothetical protein FA13DRAFT_1796274 [Coprinellus micaceus]|uniref:PAP-associated domain-containing protein n=1 Tax=Coprinellus micaceus TaxID=71717 RepID=A0A4Y7SVX8_COPMI|nr:hypothetical protein FA13DRAFT_1796274 [Coprinellus micaceus]